MQRRSFLKLSAAGVGAGLVGTRFLGAALPRAYAADGPYGAAAASERQRHPAARRVLVAGRGDERVRRARHVVHLARRARRRRVLPDRRGGWVYVSNSELSPGGASARCGSAPTARSPTPTGSCRARRATAPAAPTPWGTWLSCEETSSRPGVGMRPARGRRRGRPPGDGQLQPRGRRLRPDRPVRLPHRGRRRPASCGGSARPCGATCRAGRSKRRSSAGRRSRGPRRSPTAPRSTAARARGTRTARCGSPPRATTGCGSSTSAATPNTIRVIYDDNTSPNPVLDRRRQHRRLELRRPVRGRGRREHGARDDRARAARCRSSCGCSTSPAPRSPAPRSAPTAPASTSAPSEARAAPARASPTR